MPRAEPNSRVRMKLGKLRLAAEAAFSWPMFRGDSLLINCLGEYFDFNLLTIVWLMVWLWLLVVLS